MTAPHTHSHPTLSALVICQNEERWIARCLLSLAFCDEIIVVDGGSMDRTNEIAKRFTDNVISRPYTGTNDQKEFARQQAQGKWVLNLDADEMVPNELADEITQTLSRATSAGYRIPIKTHLGGKWLRHNGYFPGYQKRLFLREQGCWVTDREPHDHVELSGRWGKLSDSIHHDTADTLDELEAKALRYGDMAGHKLAHDGKVIDPLSAHVRPWWRFVRSYVFKHGFLDGSRGVKLAKLHYLEGREKYRVVRNS